MNKKKILIIVLGLMFINANIVRIKPVYSATNEGYGEANNNLGQFVDSFENDDNVSVAFQVINNVTLECMELNYTSGATKNYENYNTYTEVDPSNDITVGNLYFNVSSLRRDENAYLYYDYGVDYFEDFNYNFTFVYKGTEAGDLSNMAQCLICVVGNGYTRADITASDAIFIILQQSGSTDNRFRWLFRQVDGGAVTFEFIDATVYTIGTYYCNYFRSGTNATLNVFSDSAHTVLLEHFSNNGADITEYRYLCGVVGYNGAVDPADHITFDIVYFTDGSMSGGYKSDGYFTTEDYLNYTTGNSLVQVVNTSIPVGTTLQIQFSNDNITWRDNEGVALDSNILVDGWNSIFLGLLNYTDIHFRYNFTGTASLTPRVYQSRLITTNGTSISGGVTVTGVKASQILMLIFLCCLGLLIYIGVRKR